MMKDKQLNGKAELSGLKLLDSLQKPKHVQKLKLLDKLK